jgi:hypothetical protein
MMLLRSFAAEVGEEIERCGESGAHNPGIPRFSEII